MDDRHSFSPAGYRSLVAAARAGGYRFLTFGEVEANRESADRLCLMRHDVDVNIRMALDLARIEADEGIAATYFVMLRSPAYNLLGRAGAVAVREIAGLGHEIAVHFDAQHPHVTSDRIAEAVTEEARIVADLTGAPVRAVSFHQPSDYIMGGDLEVPALINTYNRRQLSGWHYISDSNRNWRGQSPWDLLSAGTERRIQILTHPMWWISGASDTAGVWNEAVTDNFRTMQRQFLDTEHAYGDARTFRIER